MSSVFVRTHSRRSGLTLLKYMKRAGNADKMLSIAILDCVNKLNREFKEFLSHDGAWHHLVDYAVVEIRGGKVSIRVDHPDALNIEYGTQARPMNPKIREFTVKAKEELSKIVSDELKMAFK